MYNILGWRATAHVGCLPDSGSKAVVSKEPHLFPEYHESLGLFRPLARVAESHRSR